MKRDMGSLCVFCGKDTAWGSGRFVNRVSADNTPDNGLFPDAWRGLYPETTLFDGYMCAECQAPDPGDECLHDCSGDGQPACSSDACNHPDEPHADWCWGCIEGLCQEEA